MSQSKTGKDSTLFQSIENHELAQSILKKQNKAIQPELLVQFEPKKCVLVKGYARYYDYIKNMEVRDDDVWVVSFIKSGNKFLRIPISNFKMLLLTDALVIENKICEQQVRLGHRR